MRLTIFINDFLYLNFSRTTTPNVSAQYDDDAILTQYAPGILGYRKITS